MVQSPSYGLKAAVMGPSIFAADRLHTHLLFTPEPEQMSSPLLSRLSNMDEGATWRLDDPHFHTSGERLVQLLMKHTIGRCNSPPHTQATEDRLPTLRTMRGTPVQKDTCESITRLVTL